MFCPHCGKEIVTDGKYCPACGKRIDRKNNNFKIILLTTIISVLVATAFVITVVMLVNKNDKKSTDSTEAIAVSSETESSATTTESIVYATTEYVFVQQPEVVADTPKNRKIADYNNAMDVQMSVYTILGNQTVYDYFCNEYRDVIIILTPEEIDKLPIEIKEVIYEYNAFYNGIPLPYYTEEGASYFYFYVDKKTDVHVGVGGSDMWELLPTPCDEYNFN